VSQSGRAASVTIANLDGSGVRTLSQKSAGLEATPLWSPDGTHIVFSATKGDQADIWVARADGSEAINLTKGKSFNTVPLWSPDGSRILYMSLEDGPRPELYVVNRDGTNRMNVTRHPHHDSDGAWVASGDAIVFMSFRDENAEIYFTRLDGSAAVRLTAHDAQDGYPRPQLCCGTGGARAAAAETPMRPGQ
jgi:TolB protein